VRRRRDYPQLAQRIHDTDKIIGLRNILAHGYDILEHEILWDVVENRIAALKQEIQRLV